MTEIKRLELQRDQADKLGEAIENVEAHFPVLQIITGKWAAIAALCWVAGRIYLPMAKDVMAGQLAGRPVPAAIETRPGAAPAMTATFDHGLSAGGGLPEGSIVPVVDEKALANEWLTGN
jgi:hypothetical protein